MRGGLLPVAGSAVAVGAVLFWTMAANDPYWRLFETPSVSAPAYESPEEIRAVLAAATVATVQPDSSATRPGVPTDAGQAEDAVLALLAPRRAEALIAGPDPLRGALVENPGGEPGRDAALARTPEMPPPPAGLLAPAAGDAAAHAVRPAALEPLAALPAPAPLWQPADAASEAALALARAERAAAQRRLALAGFDPHGFDGIFGPRTRQAIADFQAAWGFPATGYLDAAAYADLKARTEEAYVAMASRAASKPRTAPELAPVARQRRLAAAESDGCARNAEGHIIARRSLSCDLKGLAEEVLSLGRNKLAHEESDAAFTDTTAFARTADSRR